MTPSVERKILGEVRMLMEERTESGKTIDYQEQIEMLSTQINGQAARIDVLEAAKPQKEKPVDHINDFANRIKNGEDVSSDQDIQFYENNREKIEKILKILKFMAKPKAPVKAKAKAKPKSKR